MEVVVNRCYGGFGLSSKALKALIDLDSPHINPMTVEDYCSNSDVEAVKKEFTVPLEDGYYGHRLYGTILKDNFIFGINRECDSSFRSDPILVEVVKELGEESFGHYAKLEVVEIPDGVSFCIHEYDGMESIHEEHRSW